MSRFLLRLTLLTTLAAGSGALATPAPAGRVNAALVPIVAARPDLSPTIELELHGASRLTASQISLRDGGGDPIAASSATRFADGTQTLAIVFVIEGQESWMQDVVDDPDCNSDSCSTPGALGAVQSVLDGLSSQQLTANGSLGAIIMYDAGTRAVVPLGPIAAVTGSALGTLRDYDDRIGTNLVAGVELGLATLERANTSKKLLVVIGDGDDTDPEAAAPRLAQLAAIARREGIRIDGAIYRTPLSGEDTVIRWLAPALPELNRQDGVGHVVASLAGWIDGYTVVFPGDSLRWDGQVHQMTVTLGNGELEPIPVTLPAAAEVASWRPRPRTAVLLGLAIALVLAVWAGARAFRTAPDSN